VSCFVLGVPLLSTAAFFAYWHDKHAARQGTWRTSEQTLHIFGLLVLRHKSRKASLRAT